MESVNEANEPKAATMDSLPEQDDDHPDENDDGMVEDDDMGDDDDDDDDSSLLVDVSFLEHPNQAPVQKLEQPPPGLEWNDNAILECLAMAVDSHDRILLESATASEDKGGDNSDSSNLPSFQWYPPETISSRDMEFLATWKPKTLPLPVWAVDPFSSLTTEATRDEEGKDSKVA